jgi:hypothetical protein
MVLTRPATWAPYALNAGLAASVAATLPVTLWGPNVSGQTAYLTQIGSGVVGAVAANWLMRDDGTHSTVWFVTTMGVVLADLIGKSIVSQAFGFVRSFAPPAHAPAPAPAAVVATADGGVVVAPSENRGTLAGFGQPYAFRARYYPTAMAPFLSRR